MMAALVVAAPAAAQEKPAGSGDAASLTEIRFTDSSTLKLVIRDPHLELVTSYGKLTVPFSDIHRIEFGRRISAEDLRRVEAAVAQLGSNTFKEREAAQAELLALREKGYPALRKAARQADPEVVRRAEEVLARLRDTLPEEILEVPADDVVYTKDSKFTGRIASGTLNVRTTQLGDVQLKLADARRMRSLAVQQDEPEPKVVLPDPGNLTGLAQQVGKTLWFRVTGAVSGSVYGTDIYTSDSTLAVAAVHAGALKAGETGLVKVTILPNHPGFVSSTRNGITSSAWGSYAAYRVHRRNSDSSE
jgi:hypothetical protein